MSTPYLAFKRIAQKGWESRKTIKWDRTVSTIIKRDTDKEINDARIEFEEPRIYCNDDACKGH